MAKAGTIILPRQLNGHLIYMVVRDWSMGSHGATTNYYCIHSIWDNEDDAQRVLGEITSDFPNARVYSCPTNVESQFTNAIGEESFGYELNIFNGSQFRIPNETRPLTLKQRFKRKFDKLPWGKIIFISWVFWIIFCTFFFVQ